MRQIHRCKPYSNTISDPPSLSLTVRAANLLMNPNSGATSKCSISQTVRNQKTINISNLRSRREESIGANHIPIRSKTRPHAHLQYASPVCSRTQTLAAENTSIDPFLFLKPIKSIDRLLHPVRVLLCPVCVLLPQKLCPNVLFLLCSGPENS